MSSDQPVTVVIWHGPITALAARLGVPVPQIRAQAKQRHSRLEIDLVSPVSMHTLKRQLTKPEPD